MQMCFTDTENTAIHILLVIEHFHAAILLNPKLTDDNVVDATGGVCPGVRFVISTETKKSTQQRRKTIPY